MTLRTSLIDTLFEHSLLSRINATFYGLTDDTYQFVLKKMQPKRLKYTPHDTFHAIACPDTNWPLECCYHSVGECMELRDAAQTFRVVFRLKQEVEVTHSITAAGVESQEEWMHYFVIDRIDGEKALGRYLMTWKLTQ